MVLGNPLGLLGLLGIPVILLIHLLQQKRKEQQISTLFLLQHVAPESISGRRWERLRSSVPLWLQLLAVLLMTWLLVQPRWLSESAVQRIVVVLDSSLSMSVFRDRMQDALRTKLEALEEAAAQTEWIVLDSNVRLGRVYSGSDLPALFDAVSAWRPRSTAHDIQPALQIAQSLGHGRGVLIFVTDHVSDLPNGLLLLAVGEPTENVGFLGIRTEREAKTWRWSVTVKNHGRAPAERTFTVTKQPKGDPKSGNPRSGALTLAPGEAQILRGTFEGADQEITLSQDAFALDDRVFLVRPRAKRLTLFVSAEAAQLPVLRRFLKAAGQLEHVDRVGADLLVDVGKESASKKPTILFLTGKAGKKGLGSLSIAERHPLMRDLSWRGLICPAISVKRQPGDRVLLWQEERPLILLRDEHQLLVSCDLSQSNAARIPALAVLLHRFTERVRARKVAFEARNFELAQKLSIASEQRGLRERAPIEPSFFTVSENDQPLLRGGAHFADVREADLTKAASFDGVVQQAERQARKNSEQDPFTLPISLLLGCLLLVGWRFAG